MINPYRINRCILLLMVSALLISCSSRIGVQDARLAPCSSFPNCVSSDASDAEHQIAPFRLSIPATQAWMLARQQVSRLPKTQIITETADYLHAECRSALFGFVDDLELHLRPEEGVIALRSAARLGYSDLGVNRQRVEDLRAALLNLGAIH